MEILAKEDTITTALSDLRRNDEFEAFVGRKWKRVRVLRVDGCSVRVQLLRTKDQFNLRFEPITQIEVFVERTPKRDEDNIYCEACLKALSDGQLRSIAEIGDLVRSSGLKGPKMRIANALQRLARGGALIRKRKPGAGSALAYRLPLSSQIGLPVVEFLGSPNQKLGWVVRWQFMQATGREHPVVRFEDGSERACPEDFIDPAPREFEFAIGLAKRRAEGGRITPPIAVPELIIWELASAWRGNSNRKLRNENMLHIAKLIGVIDQPALDFRGARNKQAWNKTIDYLNLWYPGWQDWAAQARRVG